MELTEYTRRAAERRIIECDVTDVDELVKKVYAPYIISLTKMGTT